jgi:hypothetical protein
METNVTPVVDHLRGVKMNEFLLKLISKSLKVFNFNLKIKK